MISRNITNLGLCLATITALAVPPTSTVGVENRAGRSLDCDLIAANVQERAGPLFVTPCRGALEDHSGVVGKLGEIEGGARRNSYVIQDNSGAGSLRLGGRCGTSRTREGARGGSLNNSRLRGGGDGWSSWCCDRSRYGERCGQRNDRQEMHFVG